VSTERRLPNIFPCTLRENKFSNRCWVKETEEKNFKKFVVGMMVFLQFMFFFFAVTETLCDFDVRVHVSGGGKSAQAGAVRENIFLKIFF
jgi:ribosomal protein S9